MTFPTTNASSPKSTRARGSVLCDVLDGSVLDACVEPTFIGERALALRHLEVYRRFAKPWDILIMDRGYPAKEMIFQLSKLPGKFLFRIPKSFETAFHSHDAPDFCTHIDFHGARVFTRVVRVALTSGETEPLVTNLFSSTMTAVHLRGMAVIYGGQIVELGTTVDIFYDARHPCTRGLIQAAPSLRDDISKRRAIPGTPPDPISPPPNSRFALRCQLAGKCLNDKEPFLFEVAPGHFTSCDANTKEGA